MHFNYLDIPALSGFRQMRFQFQKRISVGRQLTKNICNCFRSFSTVDEKQYMAHVITAYNFIITSARQPALLTTAEYITTFSTGITY